MICRGSFPMAPYRDNGKASQTVSNSMRGFLSRCSKLFHLYGWKCYFWSSINDVQCSRCGVSPHSSKNILTIYSCKMLNTIHNCAVRHRTYYVFQPYRWNLFYSINVSRPHICRTLSRSYFPSVYQSLCPHSSFKQKKNLPQDRARQI